MKQFKDFLTEAYNFPIKTEKDVEDFTDDIDLQKKLKEILVYLSVKKYSPVPLAGDRTAGVVKIREVPSSDQDVVLSWMKERFPSMKWIKKGSGAKNQFGKGTLPKKGATKTPSGADWENLIVHEYNILQGKSGADSNATEAALTFDKIYRDKAINVAETFKRSLKGDSSAMTQFGAGKSQSNLSKEWLDWGGTDGTPKTDMYTDNYKISLKKAGGSQIMSGARGETLSTFNAVMQYVGENTSILRHLSTAVKKDFNKVVTDYTKTELGDLDSSEVTDEKTLEAIDSFLGTEAFHKKMNKILIEEFKNLNGNIDVRNWLVFEAMSGYTKFGLHPDSNGGENKCVASVCMEFDPDSGSITKFIPIFKGGEAVSTGVSNPDIDDKIKTLASGANYFVAWKSASGNPYSSFRITSGSSKTNESVITWRDIIREEIQNDEMSQIFLTEGVEYLNEFSAIKRVFRGIKSLGRNAITWVTNLFRKIIDKFNSVLERIVEAGSQAFGKMSEFLGIEVKSVSISMPRELEGFV